MYNVQYIMMGKWTIRIPNTKHDKTRWLDRSGKKHTIELQQSEKSVMYLYPWFLCNNAAALRGAACCQLIGGGEVDPSSGPFLQGETAYICATAV